MSYNFKQKYDFIFKCKPTTFNIYNLNQVGICDPFKIENISGSQKKFSFVPPQIEGELVYDKCRYMEGYGPKCIFIPSKQIMFKLMRACVDVQDESELWFNRKQEEPTRKIKNRQSTLRVVQNESASSPQKTSQEIQK